MASSPGCPAASKSSMPTAAQPTFRDKALFFLSYVYVKGACVSTALFMQHVAMGIFGGDFGSFPYSCFVNAFGREIN
jgi:hypothetical protein